MAARVGEAQTHQAAYDYAAAIQALESLPEQQQRGHVATLLQELRSQADQSKQLLETIKGRIATRDLDGLLELATRALTLRGDRADLRKLVAQLEEREEKLRDQKSRAFASAQRLFEAGDAKAAMEQIVPFGAGLAPEQTQFKELVKGAAWHEDELTRLLASAKADGTITAEEVVSLANQTVRCLQMNPRHGKITALLQQLVDRIEKKPADYVRKMGAMMPVVEHLRKSGQVPTHLDRLVRDHKNAISQPQWRLRSQASKRSAQSSYESYASAHRGTPSTVVCSRCGKSIPSGDLGPHLSACKG